MPVELVLGIAPAGVESRRGIVVESGVPGQEDHGGHVAPSQEEGLLHHRHPRHHVQLRPLSTEELGLSPGVTQLLLGRKQRLEAEPP
jgi:hypothetical protein